MYMQSIIINKKRGHEFEGECGGVYVRVLKEKGKGRNVITIL